jgi:hypothetical protein
MPQVLHASYSGYFPSCLFEIPDRATQSLEDAMEIYWKVKSWTLTFTSEYYDPATQTFTRTAPDETHLVCNTFDDVDAFSPYDEEGDAFYLDGPFVNSLSNPTLYGVEPEFRVTRVSEFGSRSGFTTNNKFPTPIGTYTFYGQSYPLYYTTDDVPPDFTYSGTIVPASYWTYT